MEKAIHTEPTTASFCTPKSKHSLAKPTLTKIKMDSQAIGQRRKDKQSKNNNGHKFTLLISFHSGKSKVYKRLNHKLKVKQGKKKRGFLSESNYRCF